jgi:uncharacterized C2H2 Zn-finger protein
MVSVQCPRCELLFASRNQAAWHLRQDHRRSKGLGVPDRLYQARRPRRPHEERLTGQRWLLLQP